MVKKVGRVVAVLIILVSVFTVALTITPSISCQYTSHDPISIDGNADFAEQAAEEGWPGDGTEGNPYIIEGYEIKAAKANGIEIKSTTVYFIIKGTLIKGGKYSYHGIDLDDVMNGTVKNCTFEENDYGIYIYYSNDNEIVENTFNSNYNLDIRLDYSSRNTLTGNRFVENGISISGNSLEHWNTHDIDTSNKINDKPVYYWRNQTGGTVPLDAGQIILANCTDVLIENQKLTNTSIAIQLGYSSRITIKNNNVTSNNSFGIYLYESDNNSIIENNASNNFFGIFLEQGSNRNHIMNNNFSNNSIGVDLKKSNDNHITNNLALNVWHGISTFDSYYNVITNNSISTDRYEKRGINIEYSIGNTITNNTMIECGIRIGGYLLEHWNTHNIDSSNTVNSKKVYYWKNQTGGSIPLDAGQIILANCSNITVENQNISYIDVGIQLGYSTSISIMNNTLISNDLYGIYLYHSNQNHIMGNKVSLHDWKGIYLEYSSGNQIIDNNITNNYDGIGIDFSSDNTINENYVFDNDRGIYLFSTMNNFIKNNTLLSNVDGIQLSSSNNNYISNNKVTWNSDDGIFLDSASNNTIHENIIVSNFDHGVNIGSSSNNTISSNNISNNYGGDGIHFYQSSNNNIIIENSVSLNGFNGIRLYYSNENNITSNSIFQNNQDGIYLRSSSNNSITSNDVSNNDDGINLQFSSDNSIMGNVVSNWNKGLYIVRSHRNIIDENTISDHGYGILLDLSHENIIINNNLSNNSYGINLDSSERNNISANRMIKNSISISGYSFEHWSTHNISTSNKVNDKPIYYWKDRTGGKIPNGAGQVILVNCSNVKIENQEFKYGSIGILLAYSSDNQINGNIASWNKEFGIYLHRSKENNIICNNISNNENGIYLSSSFDNVIHHNNIINNTNQLYEKSDPTNLWDDGESEGNFWSDYQGIDENDDGVGDTNLPHLDVDRYPLMKPVDITRVDLYTKDTSDNNYSDIWYLSLIFLFILIIVILFIWAMQKEKPVEATSEEGQEDKTVQENQEEEQPPQTQNEKTQERSHNRMIKIGNMIIFLAIIGTFFSGLLIITSSTVTAFTPHDPISIDGNADFAVHATNEGWLGNGTETNPYIIEGYDIYANSSSGIEISSTTVHFMINNIWVRGSYIPDEFNTYHYGILLSNVTDGTIVYSLIENNWYGIDLSSSNENYITGNIVTDNVIGIALGFSYENTITGNTVISNTLWGIFVTHSIGNNISSNKVPDNDIGIYLGSSNGNNITDNIVSNNNDGIHTFISNWNNITYNEVSSNNCGLYLYNSSNNTIHHNNFIHNFDQLRIYQNSTVNIWNDIYGQGNYWSDYTGIDEDRDGVGNTNLPHLDADYYPLMEPVDITKGDWDTSNGEDNIFSDLRFVISLILLIVVTGILFVWAMQKGKPKDTPPEVEKMGNTIEQQDESELQPSSEEEEKLKERE